MINEWFFDTLEHCIRTHARLLALLQE